MDLEEDTEYVQSVDEDLNKYFRRCKDSDDQYSKAIKMQRMATQYFYLISQAKELSNELYEIDKTFRI